MVLKLQTRKIKTVWLWLCYVDTDGFNKVTGQTYLYLVSSGEYLALALNIT